MSIIERVAELLASNPQTHQKPSPTDDGAGSREQDLIERVVANTGRRHDVREATNTAADSRASDRPQHPAGKPARTLRVDRERLRRLSMITPDGERTAMAESFRRIKRQILANASRPKTGAPPENLVLVTSALAGEGKTFCAINLAISVALEMNHTVLLVDADVAKPCVPQVFGLEAEKGLMDVLVNRRVDLADVLLKVDIGKLTLLPGGTTNKHATELLASDAMRALLHQMAERYHDRIIIFDSPPLLAASEAGVLASQMGQIVIVVEAGRTSEGALKDALGRIESSRVTGVLLNKDENPVLGYGYGSYG